MSPLPAAIAALLAEAAHHVECALAEERDDGDALAAANHYLRAVELVLCSVSELDFSSEHSARACSAVIRRKLDAYLDRASLLQRVASEAHHTAASGAEESTAEINGHGQNDG